MIKWYFYSIGIAFIHGIFYSMFVVEKANQMTILEIIFHGLLTGIILNLLAYITYRKTRRK